MTSGRWVARLGQGALAGAAGTTALNAATYVDMVVRGRPASSTPEQTVGKLLGLLQVPLPDDVDKRNARTSALGSLLGAAAGISAGAAVGALRASGRARGTRGAFLATSAVAMLVGNAPMTLLRVTDPRTWSAEDWLADLLPHLAYAAAATAAFQAVSHGSSSTRP